MREEKNNYFGVQVQILYGYVFLEGAKKWSLPKCVSCYILFVILYVWKMIFSVYGAVWSSTEFQNYENDLKTIRFKTKRKSFQQLLILVNGTNPCVCVCVSDLCLSSYLCMYSCWSVTCIFYRTHDVNSSILIGRLIIPTANQNGIRALHQILSVSVIYWRY